MLLWKFYKKISGDVFLEIEFIEEGSIKIILKGIILKDLN